MNDAIAIAAPVLARDGDEADRLIIALQSLTRVGLPVFLVDGGSGADFLKRVADLEGIAAVAPVQGSGARLVSQVRQALGLAVQAGAGSLLYTEPDKQWFFENRLSSFLAQARFTENNALVIAARDDASFATFPVFQQTTESGLHQLMERTLGFGQDATYGPLLLPVQSVALLDDLPEDLGWGWRIFLMAAWQRLGHDVHFVTDYLPCPPEQRGENEERHRIHRLEQMAQNVRGLALGLKISPRQG